MNSVFDSPAKLLWSAVPFSRLDPKTLYELLRLRQAVFVVEQDCVYPDLDGKDAQAWHVFAQSEGKMLGYSRILPPGLSYVEAASIGRVVTAASVRGTGLGRELMRRSIACCRELFPNAAIQIRAQCYLARFYRDFGFRDMGIYLMEDDIPHMEMELA